MWMLMTAKSWALLPDSPLEPDSWTDIGFVQEEFGIQRGAAWAIAWEDGAFQLVSEGPWKTRWNSPNGLFRLDDTDSSFWFIPFDWPCLLAKHLFSPFPKLVFSPP